MNARAAAWLYDADRRGVRQITETFVDSDGGMCALEVLIVEVGLRDSSTLDRLFGFSTSALQCPACDRIAREAHLIVHLNDVHHWSFSEIARKLGPDHA
jgi:hypothetical protein